MPLGSSRPRGCHLHGYVCPLFPGKQNRHDRPAGTVVVGHTRDDVISVSEEDFELTSERFGVGPAPEGLVDAQHLSTAAVRATDPMSDGDPITVDLRWDLHGGDTQVSGTADPVEGSTWGGRGRDGCMVQNWLAHQRWRWAYEGVAGTIGGVDVADLFLPNEWPAVFIEGRSTFKIIINQTGVDCVPA